MRTQGRPNLYTTEQLLSCLREYQRNHPKRKIKYAQLEKETGIKEHIWKYQMKDTIEAINKKIVKSDMPEVTGYNLPSVEDMLKNIERNPDMQVYYLQTLLDMVDSLYQYKEAKKTIDSLKADYETAIDSIKAENAELKERLQSQQDILNRYILDSESKQKREQQNIKDNILCLSPENLKKYDEMFEALIN